METSWKKQRRVPTFELARSQSLFGGCWNQTWTYCCLFSWNILESIHLKNVAVNCGQFSRLYYLLWGSRAFCKITRGSGSRLDIAGMYQFGSKTMQDIFHHISLDSVECWTWHMVYQFSRLTHLPRAPTGNTILAHLGSTLSFFHVDFDREERWTTWSSFSKRDVCE